jgi:hypothetical protein
MTSQLFRRTTIAVLPLTLWACAAPAPTPLESRHPANPAAASAPMPKLQVLQTYQDFSVKPGRAAPVEPREGQDDGVPSKGESDDHVH